jgi:hypothetical protein
VTSDQPTALTVRLAIEAAHPEIQITTPLTSKSGQWELTAKGTTATFSDFWAMTGHLAELYPGTPAPSRPPSRTGQRATPRQRTGTRRMTKTSNPAANEGGKDQPWPG